MHYDSMRKKALLCPSLPQNSLAACFGSPGCFSFSRGCSCLLQNKGCTKFNFTASCCWANTWKINSGDNHCISPGCKGCIRLSAPMGPRKMFQLSPHGDSKEAGQGALYSWWSELFIFLSNLVTMMPQLDIRQSVASVSYYDGIQFCMWLTFLSGAKGLLASDEFLVLI